ncbi:MAG: hypothetical protein AABZ92_04645 [Verrucomicrobiota bacterium]
MRVVVDIPKTLENKLKKVVKKEKSSISLAVVKAIEDYIVEKTRKEYAKKALRFFGKGYVASDAYKELEESRKDHDRI